MKIQCTRKRLLRFVQTEVARLMSQGIIKPKYRISQHGLETMINRALGRANEQTRRRLRINLMKRH